METEKKVEGKKGEERGDGAQSVCLHLVSKEFPGATDIFFFATRIFKSFLSFQDLDVFSIGRDR